MSLLYSISSSLSILFRNLTKATAGRPRKGDLLAKCSTTSKASRNMICTTAVHYHMSLGSKTPAYGSFTNFQPNALFLTINQIPRKGCTLFMYRPAFLFLAFDDWASIETTLDSIPVATWGLISLRMWMKLLNRGFLMTAPEQYSTWRLYIGL